MEQPEFQDSEAYKLWVLLSRTRDAMWAARQFELDKFNISVRQAATLYAIHNLSDNANLPDISRWVFQKSHSISELISRMERMGLVTKVKDISKSKRVRITLTEKGNEVYRDKTSKAELIEKIINILSEEECEQLGLILQKLLKTTVIELAIEERKDLLTLFSEYS